MHPDEYAKMFLLEETHWWFEGKRRLVRVLLDGLPLSPESRILDVGCGTGGMFLMLRNYTGSGLVFGAELSNLAIGYSAKRKIAHLTRATLLDLPYTDGSFDLVSAFDVLYHRRVEDDRTALKEIARVLKPGGHLVMTDSALGFLRSAHDERFHGARRYTTGEMRGKLCDAGFAVKKISYSNFFIFPALALWRLARGGVREEKGSDVHPAPAWLNALMGSVYRVEASLLRSVNLPVGSSIIALAERL